VQETSWIFDIRDCLKYIGWTRGGKGEFSRRSCAMAMAPRRLAIQHTPRLEDTLLFPTRAASREIASGGMEN
jgi:hypothetical protein